MPDPTRPPIDPRLQAWLDQAAGPVNWRTVSSADAQAQWSALRDWVDWFRAEFGYDHRVVPPCWYRHRALVHLLAALRDHWRVAYDPLNTAAGAAEWHRSLMQLETRLRDWAARTGCTSAAHRPDVVATYPDDSATWQQHLHDDITTRRQRDVLHAVAEQQ